MIVALTTLFLVSLGLFLIVAVEQSTIIHLTLEYGQGETEESARIQTLHAWYWWVEGDDECGT